MANEFRFNITATTSQWLGIWSLTRVLKKAGWRVKASSDGTTKLVSDDPLADKWNGTMTTKGSGSAASITAVEAHPYGYLITLTGLTGLTAPIVSAAGVPGGGGSEGNYLTISGSGTSANNGNWQIYQYISATSCKALVTTGTPAIDNGGAVSWVEKDAGSEVYGTGTTITNSSVGWIVLEGPETQQLSFTTAPTAGPGGATFIRGEPVTQAGTGATGECIGYLWESSIPLGWMIVMPRMGNFNNSGVITGAWSGATMTPTAFYRFRRQLVFNKTTGTTLTGGSWYQCIRNDTESANLFSGLATTAAGCTATIPPGSNGTGNAFPGAANGYAYVVRCVLNDGTTLTTTDGWYDKTIEGKNNASGTYCNGRIHIAAVDAMPNQYKSADGSFWLHHCNTNITDPASPGAVGQGTLFHFSRVDTVEPAEAELYAWHIASRGINNNTRTVNYSDCLTSQGSVTTGTCSHNVIGATKSQGTGSGETWQYQHRYINCRAVGGTVAVQTVVQQGYALTSYPTGNADPLANLSWQAREGTLGTPHRVGNSPLTIRPFFKEHPVTGNGVGGRMKYMFIAGAGAAFDTVDNESSVCIAAALSGSNIPALYIGPHDGATTLIAT